MTRTDTGACYTLDALLSDNDTMSASAALIPEWWEEQHTQTPFQMERRVTMRRPLATRPYAGERDLAAIIELLLAHKAATAQPARPSVADLRAMLSGARPAESLATRLWITLDGALVAFALLRDRTASTHLSVIIHPQERASERWLAILDEMIAWALTHARELAWKRNHAITLMMESLCDDAEFAAQLSAHGFAAQEDASVWLARTLADGDAIGEVSLPTGYHLRIAGRSEADQAAYVTLFNEAFAPNPGRRLTLDQWRVFQAHAGYVPELDLVIEAPDGSLAGLVRLVSHAEERERLGRREGEIAQLGVAPAHRGHGLGRALLRVGLHALRESGVALALLRAWDDDRAAQRLYTAEGFTPLSRITMYTQTVEGV